MDFRLQSLELRTKREEGRTENIKKQHRTIGNVQILTCKLLGISNCIKSVSASRRRHDGSMNGK